MFLSIEVIDFELFDPPEYITDYEVQEYISKDKASLNELRDYLLEDGSSLDGDKIQNKLFPESNIDIFLSHSGRDTNEVIKLAICLERKGLRVFVDSCVWSNAFDLLKSIDDKYCLNTNSMYDYEKRNYSTSHIYMMLNTALHKMIDRCEVFLFLGTPNSTSVKDGIKNKKSLTSPWILSELAFVQHVRRKSSMRTKSLHESLEDRELAANSLEIHYNKPKLDYKISSSVLESFLANTYTSGKYLTLQSLYSRLSQKKN